MRKLAPEEMKVRTQEYMPLFKLGQKWDIAMAALYLASDAGWYRWFPLSSFSVGKLEGCFSN